MKSKNEDRIPAKSIIQYCLEEKLSALREKRPIPNIVRQYECFWGRLLSEVLKRLALEMTKEERKSAGGEIYSYSELLAKSINILKGRFLNIEKRFIENPEQFQPVSFDDRLKQVFELQKSIKSASANLNDIYLKICSEPIEGLYKRFYCVIVERRLLRRYLRSRFGVINKLGKTIQKRRFRKIKEWSQWLEETYSPFPYFKMNKDTIEQEVQIAFWKYNWHLERERGLREFAENRRYEIEAEFSLLKGAVYMSLDSLKQLYPEFDFEMKEVARDILGGIKPALENFSVNLHSATIKIKNEFSLNYEEDLLNLSALVGSNLNLYLNQRLAKTLEAEGKPKEESLLERLPGSVFLALNEELNKETTLTTKVAKIIEAELPRAVGLEDFPEIAVQNFTLREEARFDLAKIERAKLILERAKLTPPQRQVWEMMKLEEKSESVVAEILNKPIGTIRSHIFRAKEKIKKAGDSLNRQ